MSLCPSQSGSPVERSRTRLAGPTAKAIPLTRTAREVRRYFLLLLMAAYVLATFLPGLGIAIRGVSLSWGSQHAIPIPTALLAVLLFSAGLGADVTAILQWRRFFRALTLGVTASWFLGPLVAIALTIALSDFSETGYTSMCVAGLALVAVMPPANSAAAWIQSAGGSLPLGLSFLIVATLFCPLVAPGMLNAISMAPPNGDAVALPHWNSTTLTLGVALPVVLGLIVRSFLSSATVKDLGPSLHLSNAAILLLLNYCQASLALPQLQSGGNAEIWWTAAAAAGLFTTALFCGGWLVARGMRVPREEQLAILFGLGMKNTGAALALAGAALAAQPAALLTIILCTLSQHILAACLDFLLRRGRPLTKGEHATSSQSQDDA
jgi:BASS family bile acid:Na+ symporter